MLKNEHTRTLQGPINQICTSVGVVNRSNDFILILACDTDESYVGKGTYLKRMKFHGKGQFGLKYRYHCHYFLKLREGPAPPKKTKRTYERHKSRITKDLWLRKTPVTIPNAL